MKTKEELLRQMSDEVLEMEEDCIEETAEEYLEAGHPVLEGIMSGLIDGMNRAGQLYEEEEYFVTDLLLCSDTMYKGLDLLKPHLTESGQKEKKTAVIGVVEGDTHDIGKNLVRIMMETAGFEMIDLGMDVPLMQFIDAAEAHEADLVCLSTLMTTTMPGMEKVIHLLEEAGLRKKVKVMIGGGPVTQKYADKIGADAYSSNANEAVKTAKKLLNME